MPPVAVGPQRRAQPVDFVQLYGTGWSHSCNPRWVSDVSSGMQTPVLVSNSVKTWCHAIPDDG